MPRFSVIVPAYQVQAYLTESLRSVLTQSYDDLELIAVDDCSPDACGAIVDEFAAEDRRVVAVHLPANGGLGPARNAGIARATGDYLIFLDGDDTLVPGALQAITDRLKETGGPDVLVHDHARTYWTGESVRGGVVAPLTEEGPAAFQLANRPALLTTLLAAWNKAYRREFIEREGVTFPPGRHADIAWAYPVLMTAGTIATLDRVCVRDRRHRTARERTHLDLFAQYDRVFAFLDERPELARWRPVLHRRMLDHFAALAATEGQMSRRAEFFRRARAHHRRYRTPGAARLRHALLRLGAHRTYLTLRAARQLRGHAGRLTAGLGRLARTAALRLHYRVQRQLPVRSDRAVFAAHGGYAGDPAAIEEKVRELVPRVRTAWLVEPALQHTVPTGTRRLRPGTFGYWTALARSRYLVTNTALPLAKRPGQLLLQTHPGTPLKSVGLDLLDRPAAAGPADIARLLDDADTWDFSLSANRHSTLVREKAFPAGFTTLEYGHPRNDVFQRATAADVARLRETLGIPEGYTAVLYAPTRRDYRRSHYLPLALERVVRCLGPRFVLLTRAHPGYGEPLPHAPHPRIIDVSAHPSVETLCLASDALVTDYSSLMFDYANLDRPIVIHCDDQPAYEAARGTYFDLRAFPPGAVARTEDELIDIFTSDHWRGSRSSQLRTAFRTRFCPYDDGQAAERVVRHVFLGETAGLPVPLPQEERRPAPRPVFLPHQTHPAPARAATAYGESREALSLD
ncbi:bifunctional glycosyltransferase/CDP-glycerol:glycerophosphate glycerophosphotransferase [Streptomyces sp. NBC_00370]|uniref:bifunctional glycosyltransferase/CDP-glycerol:glycerophosphate glycerophosphotransferase n=1 Tax=Streptomyces sp. NBC_00370 TaxID=2975728 RepID=UPI002E266C4C